MVNNNLFLYTIIELNKKEPSTTRFKMLMTSHYKS